jgi:hypothetical protein
MWWYPWGGARRGPVWVHRVVSTMSAVSPLYPVNGHRQLDRPRPKSAKTRRDSCTAAIISFTRSPRRRGAGTPL